MNGIIEEKVHWDIKLMVFIIAIPLLLDIKELIMSLFEYGIDTNTEQDLIFYIFFTIAFIVYSPFLLKSATKLKLGNDTITVKLAFRKSIVIPLENIEQIEKWPYAGTPFHFIKSKEKNFNTLLISMSFNQRGLVRFIEELQRRVFEAKKRSE